ncbi:MAG: dTDP-4-dehydrorhamnose reductase [Bacteroidota bacterium]
MKILVTGANGLLGQKLISLLQKDTTVYPVSTARGKSAIMLERGEFHSLDITDASEVERVLSTVRPDVVINTAAMTNVDQCETQQDACWKANVTSVENLVHACKKNGVRLIHVSTDFIFDGSHGPLDENEKPGPVNYYGESKLAAEKLILSSDIDWCILRTVLVFGITNDMSRSNIVLWVKNSLEQKKSIQVVNDQWRTPTLAEDLANGCYLAAKKKASGIYHISGKDFLSPYDIAIKTADFFKLDKSLIKPTDSTQFKQPARRPLTTGFVIEKARKELGYEPHSFEEGLQILFQQLVTAE